MEKYMRLVDEDNFGVIIKATDRYTYEYVYGINSRWRQFGMMLYYNDDSEKYDKYEEISEENAKMEIKKQSIILESLYENLSECVSKAEPDKKGLLHYMINTDISDDLEREIVAIIYGSGSEKYEEIKNSISLSRIKKSLSYLFSFDPHFNETDLINMRIHRNTRLISRKIVEYWYDNEMISIDKKIILTQFFDQKIIMPDIDQKIILFS